MHASAREPAHRWLARRAERLTPLSANHPFAIDLAVCLATAALSIANLAIGRRLDALTVIFCGALCLPLLARRRLSPFLCFAAIAVVAFAQWLLSSPQLADAALLIALYRVALDGTLIEGALAAAIIELGAVMAAVRWSTAEPLKVWIGLSGLATAAGVLGVSIRQRRALLASLKEKAARLEFERDQEGRLGAAAERARIAREMHDIVAHNLSVIIALADGATYAMDSSPGRAREATERVSATGRQALLEMRRLLGVLREESPEHPLQPQPSLDRLDELLARVHAAGIPVTMDLDGDPHQLPDGVQLTVYRVAQEALTNTLKHAARPTSAHLSLRCHPGQVELEVTDTGDTLPLDTATASSPDTVTAPFPDRATGPSPDTVTTLSPAPSGGGSPAPPGDSPPTSGGRGLRGMRERAAAYGGRLEAGPGPGGGWRVRLRLQPDAQTATP